MKEKKYIKKIRNLISKKTVVNSECLYVYNYQKTAANLLLDFKTSWKKILVIISVFIKHDFIKLLKLNTFKPQNEYLHLCLTQ